MKSFLLSLLLMGSLCAQGVEYSPYPFSPYRLQSFGELALLEVKRDGLALDIEKTILAFILEHGYIGSVIVAVEGEVVFAEGFGQQRTSRGPVNRPETTFRWDSVTKLFTAVAMIQLSEMGRVDLDAPITTYLSEYSDPVTYPGFAGTPSVTIRSLLAMESGIAESPEDVNWLDRIPTIMDIANYVAVRERSGIGEWRYVNSGFNICALILGRVVDPARDASLVFQEFLQEHIFTPAGMATAFAPAFVAQDRPDAQGHVWDTEGRLQVIGTDQFPNYTQMRVGTGNINGSVWDFERFTVALNSYQLITEADLNMMLEQRLGGWVPIPHDVLGHPYMDKDGGQTGQRAYYMRFEDETMIFITSNSDPRTLNPATGRVEDRSNMIENLGVQIAQVLFRSE